MTIAIEQLAVAVGEHLKTRGWKLVTAESCTGGCLACAITAIPGSSNWFERGFITYSNTSKKDNSFLPIEFSFISTRRGIALNNMYEIPTVIKKKL